MVVSSVIIILLMTVLLIVHTYIYIYISIYLIFLFIGLLMSLGFHPFFGATWATGTWCVVSQGPEATAAWQTVFAAAGAQANNIDAKAGCDWICWWPLSQSTRNCDKRLNCWWDLVFFESQVGTRY